MHLLYRLQKHSSCKIDFFAGLEDLEEDFHFASFALPFPSELMDTFTGPAVQFHTGMGYKTQFWLKWLKSTIIPAFALYCKNVLSCSCVTLSAMLSRRSKHWSKGHCLSYYHVATSVQLGCLGFCVKPPSIWWDINHTLTCQKSIFLCS